MPRDDAADAARPVVLVHSSDLHIDDDNEPGLYNGLEGLRYVLRAAEAEDADVLLLAGDTFDNGRVATAVAQRAAALLSQARMPVVLLPGNHDPAMAEGIFHRSGILGLERAMVIGHTHPERLLFGHLDLEILGRPHRSYNNMAPLPVVPERTTRWQVIIAHGHYVPPSEWHEDTHRSWRMSADDIARTGVDYIALGHWDRPEAVGDGRVRAYYSGAPDLARTVNVIRLDPEAGVSVARRALDMPFPPRW